MAIKLSRPVPAGKSAVRYRTKRNLRSAAWLTKDNWPHTIAPRNNG